MASARDFPDVIREGDPLLGNSYRHYYGGAYYHLLFPDWPEGYRRDVQAAVYLEDKEKGEHRRVPNETLSEAVRKDYWKEIDYMNTHPMTDGPSMERFERDLREYAKNYPTPPYIPFGGLTDLAEKQQKSIPGMMDGPGMLAPQFRSALLESMEKGSAAEDHAPWTCPACGKTGNTGKFCSECARARPAKNAGWTCPGCGKKGNTGKFCPECGRPKPVKGEGWTCPKCGTEGNKGNFCAGCGAGRPDGGDW